MGVEPFGADSSGVETPKESAGVESPEFGEDVPEGVEHVEENILEAELSDQETTEQQTVAGSGSAPGEPGAEGEEEEDLGSNVELGGRGEWQWQKGSGRCVPMPISSSFPS